MYKLIAFDLDGTILNTLGDLENSINHVLEEYDFPRRTLDEVRCFVGNGVLKLVERAVPENTSRDIILEIFNRFKEYYLSHLNIKSVPYEGIKELLVELRNRGCKIAVVSNKIHPAVVELCNEFFSGLIDFSLGDDPVRPKKPHPAMLEYAMKELNVTKEETLYVGDSEVDIETAINTGVDYISVDWGFKTHEFLVQHNSKNIVSSMEELLDKIIKY
jgi:phosphoglycolate phosphatase